MSAPYRQILYRSLPSHPDFDRSDVAILRTALQFNAASGITGYLVRTADQFLQALHGPQAAMEALLARIAADDRHSGFDMLLDEDGSAESPFEGWALGYDHFFEMEHGLELTGDGAPPPVSVAQARDLILALARAAADTLRFGSGFPQARMPGETDDAYLSRLEQMA
ncbi:MAG: hypothetical protein BGP11_08920 [Rhodobacterales bacterium 65-51]|uniref:BLUF domain-containing protein n=1 Tax=uncultured Gemmobacter sp. TaxID=1095917 RepID=UPI000965D33C|nr:BLUF domain-containing protein [uncultured Gemmobacter sp.]OJY31703.1 MAG: hypothetical protein BGP11_08920 [Rhodobacterales bacterium 65-51]